QPRARRRGRARRLRPAAGLPPDPRAADDPAPSVGHACRAAVDPPAGPGRVPRAGGVGPRGGGTRARAARARRRPHLPARPHAAAGARLAARPAAAAGLPPRPPRPGGARGGGVSDDLRALFLRHLCQTSATPLGLIVARAAGSTIWDTAGRAYLDLLAGMGV